jgi:glucose-1-phosphate thymidylyltransferase
MKGLILAAGSGTRLRPITYTRAKPLIPVAGRYIITYPIEKLLEVGIDDIGIVVGANEAEVRDCLSRAYPSRKFSFVRQNEPLGLAHACRSAARFLSREPFCMLLGDNLFGDSLETPLFKFTDGGYNCLLTLFPVENPQSFGVAEVEGERVVRLVEKPPMPTSNLAITGIYFFDEAIFKAIERVRPSARGELEITDAMQSLIDHGMKVGYTKLSGWWKDTGRLPDLLEANRTILSYLKASVKGDVASSEVRGALHLPATSRIVNSTVVGPVWVGPDVTIADSTVGPNVAVHAGTTLAGVSVEDSIVMEEVTITSVKRRILSSLIGTKTQILSATEDGIVLFLGDACEVHL